MRYIPVLLVGVILPAPPSFSRHSDTTKRAEQAEELAKDFIYPRCRQIEAKYGSGSPVYLAKFVSRDSIDCITNWYQARVSGSPRPRAEGILSEGRDVWAVMHDSTRPAPEHNKDTTNRPLVLEVLTKSTEAYTVNFVISRGNAESETHIILTLFLHPR